MIFLFSICFVLFINLLVNKKYAVSPIPEVLIGIIIGIPTVAYIKNIKSFNIDLILGNLSYGVFLNHFFVMYVMSIITGHMPTNTIERILMLLFSTILAFASYKIIEEPFMKRRRVLIRENNSDVIG